MTDEGITIPAGDYALLKCLLRSALESNRFSQQLRSVLSIATILHVEFDEFLCYHGQCPPARVEAAGGREPLPPALSGGPGGRAPGTDEYLGGKAPGTDEYLGGKAPGTDEYLGDGAPGTDEYSRPHTRLPWKE